MAQPNCLICKYRGAVKSGLCSTCFVEFRRSGYDLRALEEEQPQLIATTAKVLAERFLRAIPRDSDEEIAQRRRDLVTATSKKRAV